MPGINAIPQSATSNGSSNLSPSTIRRSDPIPISNTHHSARQPAASLTGGRVPRNQRSFSRTPRQHATGTTPTTPTTPAQSIVRTRAMSIGSRKAPLPIDFIIVGAGIAGLATAFALAQSGHRVRIFEKRSGINQRAVGVRVPPNLCKILYEWGLQEELATATRCRKSAFHSSKSLLSCALFSRLCACVPMFATVPRSFAFCILPDFFYPSAGTISSPCLLMVPSLSARHHFSCLIPLFATFWDDLSFWISAVM